MVNGDRKEPTIGDIELDAASRRPAISQRKKTAPRRPWLAFLLGFLIGPLSWAYVGRYEIGVFLYFAQIGLLAAMGLSGLAQSATGAWLIVSFGLATTLIGIIGPWFIARRLGDRFVPHWYNRWFWYPILWLVVVVPFGFAAFNKAKFFGVGTYRVPSSSMAPTISPGDFIVADTRSSAVDRISRGDIVVHYAK